MDNVITYTQYQNLSDADKANYEPHWNSDGKSGVAYKKGYKPAATTFPSAATMSAASDSKSYKSVLTPEEARAAGIKTSDLTGKNGYVDAQGNVHLNSAADEARTRAVEEDIAQNRDYKTAKAPSRYQLDLRNKTLDGKNTDGSYTYSDKELQTIISSYKDSDPELAKAAQDELDKRTPKAEATKAEAPKVSNLGGRSTEEWVAWMKSQGFSDEEIADAYEKEGYSRNGAKFTAAMEKYSSKAEEAKAEEANVEEAKAGETKVDEDKPTKEDVPETKKEIQKFSSNLNRFVIQAYRNGDFGDPNSKDAKLTAGYFILDKIANSIVNASLVARGMSPSQKSEWNKVLDKQTELLGKDLTARWWNNQDTDTQQALLKTQEVGGTTAQNVYENTDNTAIGNAKTKDMLEVTKLSQEQKSIATQNLTALMQRKTELQQLLASISADMGWDDYAKAMNAIVGTARGLNSVGVTEGANTANAKNFSEALGVSANLSTGSIAAKFVDVGGNISSNTAWGNSSAEALSKNNTMSKDALALSKFQSGEQYAKASADARKAANEELKEGIKQQIAQIDAVIKAWGSDLGIKE